MKTNNFLPGDIIFSALGIRRRNGLEYSLGDQLLIDGSDSAVWTNLNANFIKLSPDNKKLACITTRDSTTTFYVIDFSDQNDVKILTSVAAGSTRDLRWSPDSETIFAVSSAVPYLRRYRASDLTALAGFNMTLSTTYNQLDISTDGKYLLTFREGSTAAELIVYDLELDSQVDLSSSGIGIHSYIGVSFIPGTHKIMARRRSSTTGNFFIDIDDLAAGLKTFSMGSSTAIQKIHFSPNGENGRTSSNVYFKLSNIQGNVQDIIYTEIVATYEDQYATSAAPSLTDCIFVSNTVAITSSTVGIRMSQFLNDGSVKVKLLGSQITDMTALCVLPGFSLRQIEGTVVDANDIPIKRTIRAFSKETGRFLNNVTSDPVTGEYVLDVYCGTQLSVICVGEGSEASKMIDNIIPAIPTNP